MPLVRMGMTNLFKTHIKELQKRDVQLPSIPYAQGASVKEMKEEARIFYKMLLHTNLPITGLTLKRKPCLIWRKVSKLFLAELKRLGADKVGLYIGAYFMLEQEVSTRNFDAVWIPAYGTDSGYYETLPNTDIDYDLHQYTSQGSLPGFDNILDLSQINPEKNKRKTFEKNSLVRLSKTN